MLAPPGVSAPPRGNPGSATDSPDTLKHDFLQTNAAKFVKPMLLITLKPRDNNKGKFSLFRVCSV